MWKGGPEAVMSRQVGAMDLTGLTTEKALTWVVQAPNVQVSNLKKTENYNYNYDGTKR